MEKTIHVYIARPYKFLCEISKKNYTDSENCVYNILKNSTRFMWGGVARLSWKKRNSLMMSKDLTIHVKEKKFVLTLSVGARSEKINRKRITIADGVTF